MNTSKHILIDGWNAIHSHPKLSRMLAENRAEEAQSCLWDMLAPIHDYDGKRVTIVYDGKGVEVSIVRRSRILTFSEVYTPSSMTADELIEQLCATSKHPQDLLVVTRDNLLRLTSSSFGAISITPEKFFEWGNESKKAVRKKTELNNAQGALEWKKSTPFAKLDELLIDIKSATASSPLVSKHLKRKLKRETKKENKEIVASNSLQKVAVADKSGKKNLEQNRIRPRIGGKAASQKSLNELKVIWEKRGK